MEIDPLKLSLNNPKGILYMLTAAFLFAILGYFIKIVGPRFSVWDISFFRFFGSMVILLLVFGRGRRLFKPKNPKLIIARGVFGSMAFLLIVFGIRMIPLSVAMVFLYSFPAFAAIFSPLLFGEKILKIEGLFIATALMGIVILFDFHLGGPVIGQVMALLSGVIAGLTISIIKKLRPDHGSVIIYFYFCLVGSIVTLVPFLVSPELPSGFMEWGIMGGIIITATGGQLLMNRGFHYCKSWEGGLFLTSELIFTSIIGIIFLGEIVSWRFWVGGLLIFGSTVAFNMTMKNNH